MADDGGSVDEVRIERTLDAPVEVVWQMWTDPEHFRAWFGPAGATVPVAKLDVRVGGLRLVGMEVDTPGGLRQIWLTGEHREVVAPTRLVYTESLADEEGRVLDPTEAGLPDGHPAITEVTVVLEALGDRTRMVMTHAGLPADSPGAAGWAMSFDKLEATLAAS